MRTWKRRAVAPNPDATLCRTTAQEEHLFSNSRFHRIDRSCPKQKGAIFVSILKTKDKNVVSKWG
ncbi:hypothetical protein JW916_03680, partial [Candidatus Sumerlaeota bacterium]|nr:hypothetical protein [Candidatus Sumerlaeota bacterium]